MYAKSSCPSPSKSPAASMRIQASLGPNFRRCREMAVPIVPQNDALAAIAVRDEQVERSITVEVRRYDGCCRFCRERFAGGKVALAVVEADVTRRGNLGAFAGFAVHGVRIVATVGHNDVRIAVAVQVRECHISRSPV